MHGFIVYERTDGLKIKHFRSCRQYGQAYCRVVDLCRDRRFADKDRDFEIWDGCNAVSKIYFRPKSATRLVIKSYLIQPRDKREEAQLDRDRYLSKKSSLKNQRVGKDRSDLTGWVKSDKRLDRELVRKENPKGYRVSTREIKRVFGGEAAKKGR